MFGIVPSNTNCNFNTMLVLLTLFCTRRTKGEINKKKCILTKICTEMLFFLFSNIYCYNSRTNLSIYYTI